MLITCFVLCGVPFRPQSQSLWSLFHFIKTLTDMPFGVSFRKTELLLLKRICVDIDIGLLL